MPPADPTGAIPDIWDTLRAFGAELRGALADDLVGVYVYGSIAYGAFRPGVSDVDVAVVHRAQLTQPQRQRLEGLHRWLPRRHPSAGRLDVSYAPLRLIGAYGDATLAGFRDGRFRPYGGGDVNPLMWHTLHTRGIAVIGPPPTQVVPPVSREALAANMRQNLTFLARRMPRYTLGGTEHLVFGVLTLCRVLYTLHTQEVASKEAAAVWAQGHVDPRWRPLVERALSRYRTGDLAGRDWLLTRQARAFVADASKAAR